MEYAESIGGRMYDVGTFYQYDYGSVYGQTVPLLLTDKADYDYGIVTSACQRLASSPTRETVTTYKTFADTPIVPGTPSIQDRPYTVTVSGNGMQLSETTYNYDQNAVAPVTPVAIAHDENNYGPNATAPRGNMTSVTRSCSPNCSSPTVQYGYDETGQVVSLTDANLNQPTTFSYSDSFASADGTPPGNTNTYLTQVTGPATNGVSHIQTFTYEYENGKCVVLYRRRQ
jgi:hypothetical protein